MAIWTNLDGHDFIGNFERAMLGPGVYVLFDGRVSDGNIVYIGKSTVNVLVRVRSHLQNKDFDRVGIILPHDTSDEKIHNLEHLVVQEYLERFGQLPAFNKQTPHWLDGERRFDWHNMRRRPGDVDFL